MATLNIAQTSARIVRIPHLRGRSSVVDRNTGAPGLIFFQSSITRISENRVQVSGGYHEGGESASANDYTVEKSDGKWIVTKNLMRMISQISRPHDAAVITIARAEQ